MQQFTLVRPSVKELFKRYPNRMQSIKEETKSEAEEVSIEAVTFDAK